MSRDVTVTSLTDRPPPRWSSPRWYRRRVVLVLASAAVLGMAIAWYLGAFTSNGRFSGLDACSLLPPPDVLAPLVSHGAQEPGTRPRNIFDRADGASECKWSSVPAGRDDPFRTVRVYTRTTVRDRHTSAEATARKALAIWYLNSSQRDGGQVKGVELGEQGYTVTDTMVLQILFTHVVIYDLHAMFRISNALVDVSARTHAKPTEKDMALVLGLAENVAARLLSVGPR